jgi:hypothetical protein
MRIDQLEPGTEVILKFHGGNGNKGYTNKNYFVEIVGKGENRRAVFSFCKEVDEHSTWEAYRYNGRWAYGSGAHRLSLVE